MPLLIVALSAFNLAVIVQEFARGVARTPAFAAKRAATQESSALALLRLVEKSRRRYGGYIVHVGITMMFLGYAGNAWKIERETSMVPGEKYQIGQYELTYQGSRREVDQTKMMIFSDLKVTRDGKPVGSVHPAKFIYKRMPQSPTSEVSMLQLVPGGPVRGRRNRRSHRPSARHFSFTSIRWCRGSGRLSAS